MVKKGKCFNCEKTKEIFIKNTKFNICKKCFCMDFEFTNRTQASVPTEFIFDKFMRYINVSDNLILHMNEYVVNYYKNIAKENSKLIEDNTNLRNGINFIEIPQNQTIYRQYVPKQKK